MLQFLFNEFDEFQNNRGFGSTKWTIDFDGVAVFSHGANTSLVDQFAYLESSHVVKGWFLDTQGFEVVFDEGNQFLKQFWSGSPNAYQSGLEHLQSQVPNEKKYLVHNKHGINKTDSQVTKPYDLLLKIIR